MPLIKCFRTLMVKTILVKECVESDLKDSRTAIFTTKIDIAELEVLLKAKSKRSGTIIWRNYSEARNLNELRLDPKIWGMAVVCLKFKARRNICIAL